MLVSSKKISTAQVSVENAVQSAVVATTVSAADMQVPAVGSKLQLINPNDINSVENLGERYSTVLQNLSSSLNTSEVKLKNMGKIGTNITSLMHSVKSLDPMMINEKPGFFGKLLGKAKNGIDNFIDSQKSVDQSVKEVSLKLLDDRQELIQENVALESTYTENIKVLNEMEDILLVGANDVAILKQQLQEFQNSKQTMDDDDALEIQRQKHLIERVEQKLSRLNNGRALALRQLPQIRIIQSANNTEIDTIKDVIDVAVPLWKSQLNLYISQLKTAAAVQTRQSVTNVINETIQQNSILMNQNVTDIAAGYNSDIITSDTIKIVNDNLLETIEQFLRAIAEVKNEIGEDEFMNKKKGFTLIELLVVIGILGILAAALVAASASCLNPPVRNVSKLSFLPPRPMSLVSSFPV
jgi:prepilin-type N-terminal cleavage/methylation domain-containing protein